MQPSAPQKNPHVLDPTALKELWRYNFTNHTPTPEGIRKIEALRSAAKVMADAIIDICPGGRDQALALTSLEQMLFHANAAVARNMNVDVEPKQPEEDKALPDQPKKEDS